MSFLTLKAENLTKRQVISLLRFRKPMEIDISSGYIQCPLCKSCGLRDYQRFCSVCGQRLSWKPLWQKTHNEELITDLKYEKEYLEGLLNHPNKRVRKIALHGVENLKKRILELQQKEELL